MSNSIPILFLHEADDIHASCGFANFTPILVWVQAALEGDSEDFSIIIPSSLPISTAGECLAFKKVLIAADFHSLGKYITLKQSVYICWR